MDIVRVECNVASRLRFEDGSKVPPEARFSPHMRGKDGVRLDRFKFIGILSHPTDAAANFKDHDKPFFFVKGASGIVFEVCECCVKELV